MAGRGIFGAPMLPGFSGLSDAIGSLTPAVPPSAAPVANSWQDRYAKKNWQAGLTRLNPRDETRFQEWALRTGAPITDDYDMRGFWRNGGQTEVNHNDHQLHFTDRYKTPLHESFSGESIYADPRSRPPMWNSRDQLVAPDGSILFDERAIARRRR